MRDVTIAVQNTGVGELRPENVEGGLTHVVLVYLTAKEAGTLRFLADEAEMDPAHLARIAVSEYVTLS